MALPAGHADPFLSALLEMPTTNAKTSRSPLKMALSLLIHTGVIALLIILPVYFATTTISTAKLTPTYVFTAPPKLAPPPPAAAAAPRTSAPSVAHLIQPTPLVAPRVIPTHVAVAASTMAAPTLADAGVIGGVPGGVPGGVLGGVLGGTGTAGPPPPTNSRGLVRVGGNVRPPELVERVQPSYPSVARAAHVEGTVVIDAIIDTNGKVISEQAVSGPGLLIPAALSAVQQWQYQPTILNGQPVQLAMEVTVSFNLT
jgi:protein TonB